MVTIESIVSDVMDKMPHGRTASWPSMAKFMMENVQMAGSLPHLEIGVMHGGTLIMAALVKKHIVGSGKVFGIDPLDGYYPANALHVDGVKTNAGCLITREKTDRDTNVPISMETLRRNIDYFDVGEVITVLKTFSYPWPEQLYHVKFGSIYIDGDHYQEGPLVDFVNVQRHALTGTIVMFDDCNDNCPGVQRAAQVAANTPGWEFITHHQNHCFVVRKR